MPKGHPLGPLRVMVDAALKAMGPRLAQLYATSGRPSIAPEQLLRGRLLQMLYSVRSERMLMEQLAYHLLFRWLVGLRMDDVGWAVTGFTKNRERLLAGEVTQGFFQPVVAQARTQGWRSAEPFTVDGTLLEAWAGPKRCKPKHHPPPASCPLVLNALITAANFWTAAKQAIRLASAVTARACASTL